MKITLTAAMIKALEEKGFKRWQKYDYDRLYVEPDVLGLELSYYKSGYVGEAWLDDERISNSKAMKMFPRGTKMYIDLQTNEIEAPGWAVERIEKMIADAEKEAETSEIAALVEQDRVAEQAEADLVEYILSHRDMYEIEMGLIDATEEQDREYSYYFSKNLTKKKEEIEPLLTGKPIDPEWKRTPKANVIEGRIVQKIREEIRNEFQKRRAAV